jgi:hypothetical protein
MLVVAKMRAAACQGGEHLSGSKTWRGFRAFSEKPSHVFGEVGRHKKGSSIRHPNVQTPKSAYRNFIFTSSQSYLFSIKTYKYY